MCSISITHLGYDQMRIIFFPLGRVITHDAADGALAEGLSIPLSSSPMVSVDCQDCQVKRKALRMNVFGPPMSLFFTC